MVVVKNLALGVLLTGIVAGPSFGGASQHEHGPSRAANGDLHGPTTLSFAGQTRPFVGATENLATVGNGSFGLGNSGYGPAYGSGYGQGSYGNALGTTSSVWGSASNDPGTASYPAGPAQPTSTPPPVYTAPTSTGLSLAGLQGGGGAPSASGHTVDAYLNFGTSAYSEASSLTTGNPQAWTQSAAVQSVFHGTPDASQQAGFIAEVMQTVQHTYALSGLNVSLTTDPTQNFAHTMSVVSGASYTANPNAIGITDVGNDGYSFIDKFGQAKTADELAVAVGHNIAHELMHAFGVAEHPDQSGTHIDAATATWNILTNPESTLSDQAAQLLSTKNFLTGPGKEFTQGELGLTGLELLAQHHPATCHCPFCNTLHQIKSAEGLAADGPAAVPEPATFALWGLAGGIALACRRRHGKPA